MAKNRLEDLNDYLFLALESLDNKDLSPEELQREIQRAKTISEVGGKIIDLAKVSLESIKVQEDYLGRGSSVPKLFQPHSLPKLGEKNA